MREEFSAYRVVDKRKLKKLWSTAIFSFDSNTLLNLYGSEAQTTEQFFSILEGLKDRIWLTHQAGREFYDNRSGIIARGRKELTKLVELTRTSPNFVRTIAAEKIAKILKDEADNFEIFLDRDPIESRLNTLFAGRLGSPYRKLHDQYIEAEQRFKLKIPPGFRDEAKDDYRKYGDVILWFQLLDHAIEKRTNMILVTADSKSDWWLTGDQKLKLGPRPELALEMRARAGTDFHMYSPTEFVKHAGDLLGVKSKPAKVKEALRDLQRIEHQNDAPFLPAVPTGWPGSAYPSSIFVGDNRPVAYGPGGTVVPAIGSSQFYEVFQDSSAGTFQSPFGPPPRLFDAAGNPIFQPFRGAIFVTPQSQTETVPAAESTPEKKKKGSDKE